MFVIVLMIVIVMVTMFQIMVVKRLGMHNESLNEDDNDNEDEPPHTAGTEARPANAV